MAISIIQTSLYLILLFSIIYFGGISVVGNAVTIGTLALVGIVARLLKIRFRSNATTWLFFSWLIVLALSSFFSVNEQASVSMLATYMSYFFMFSIIVSVFDQKSLVRFYNVLFYVGCVVAVYGICALLMKETSLFSVQKKYYLDRLTATFINPNHSASFLGMMIPLGVYFIITAQGLKRVLYTVCTLCVAIAFVLTFSLGAFVAGIATIAASVFVTGLLLLKKDKATRIHYFWARFFKRKKLPRLFQRLDPALSLIAIVIVIALICVIVLIFRGEEMITVKSYSLWERGNLYKGALSSSFLTQDALLLDPRTFFVGAGLGCFREIFHGAYANYSVVEFNHAHNEYLEQLMEIGAGGLTLFLLIVISLVYAGWRYSQSETKKEHSYFVAALAMSTTFILFHGMFDFPLRLPANGLLFFSMIGSLVVFMRVNSENSKKRLSVLVSVAIIAIGCFMILYAARNIAVQSLITHAEQKYIENDMDGVEHAFATARDLNPHDPELVIAYGEYLKFRAFSQEKSERVYYQKVRDLYSDAITQNPHLPANYLRLAWVYAQGKEFDKAEEYFNKAIEVNPYFLIPHIQRAHFYLYSNDLDKAVEGYTYVLEALFLMPYSPYSKANILIEQLYAHMQTYPLHPALGGVYKRLAEYHEQFKTA